MFGISHKKIDKSAVVAVCGDDDGIAVARVRRARDLPPTLELCETRAGGSMSVQGAGIAQMTKSLGLDHNVCVTTLAIGTYSLLFVEAPDVPPAELRAAIRWRVKDLIDFHIDDAVIDVFEVPDQKASGTNTMMYAVVARSSAVRQQIELLNGAGLNLEIIDIPELALRNLTALLPEDVAGVAFLYLGSHSGLITLTRQGTLYLSRRLDSGWSQLGDNLQDAESRLDRIVVEIQRSLDYYESHFLQPAIGAVVVSPRPPALDGIENYLADQLGMPVRGMDINRIIDVERELTAEVQLHCAMAVGAALRQETVQL